MNPVTDKYLLPKTTITLDEMNSLVKEVENFYEERNNPKINVFWLADLMVRRLRKDKDFYANIEGDTGCLSGDTKIKVSRAKNTRTWTLKKLYLKANGLEKKTKRKPFDMTIPMFIRSFNGKEIRLHKINKVLYSGKKKVYKLVLENGLEIKATSDHRVMTMKGWIEVKNLKKDDLVMCDTPNAQSLKRKRIKLRDIGLSVGKNHPYNIQPNKQISVHTLIYEAKMNNLSFTNYLDILLNEPEKCKNLKFINPSKYLIHHRDGNHYNNSVENLEKLMKKDHSLEHNNYSNFSQGKPKFSEVGSITYVGEEDTYDISCEEPYHNFVANNIVVHNSGKSNLILLVALLMCRYAGTWRNKIDGKLVTTYPRTNPLDPKEWEQLTINFDFNKNMSFLDKTEELKKKYNALDRYMPFIIDEGSKNLHKYGWQNKLQQMLIMLSQTERYQNKAFFICFPNFKELTTTFRNDRIKMRLYIYDRNTKQRYASCIISMKDVNRWISDPWHMEENAKSFEYLLKRIPIASRSAYHVLKAERKLKGYAGNFDFPSLKHISPRIWKIYMKFKIENAQKEQGTEEETKDSVRLTKWKYATKQLMY